MLLGTVTERNLDTLLQLAADRRRRQVVHYLRHEPNAKTTIQDLVDRMQIDGSDGDDHSTDREQLAIQLYHNHLPKLAAHGVVAFEPENQAVRYQSDEEFERILDALPEELPLASS